MEAERCRVDDTSACKQELGIQALRDSLTIAPGTGSEIPTLRHQGKPLGARTNVHKKRLTAKELGYMYFKIDRGCAALTLRYQRHAG
jgi:hypothetical protein